MDRSYNSKDTPLAWLITQIGSLWIMSGIGYYYFLPVFFGFERGYNANPIQITLYYSFWIILTLFSFWNIYREWRPFESRLIVYLVVFFVGTFGLFYIREVLPLFPPVDLNNSWIPPSDLLVATPWYFLPKSFDILLQQFLVLAMVLSFSLKGHSFKSISLWSATLFGGAHILLVFGGKSMFYVVGFTFFATLASFIFTYLILRVKNGFVYSYLVHWLFYAIVIILARIFL